MEGLHEWIEAEGIPASVLKIDADDGVMMMIKE
jgi:hypothetical protein